MSIEVNNETDARVDERELVDLARHVLSEMRVHPQAELSVILVDEVAMERLHVQWMDLPGPTDVMSFPMDELDTARRPDEMGPGPALLGDVVLCPAVATEQAVQAGHSLDDELHLLTVHGILHLLGFDHAEPADERKMFTLQNELLDDWREERERQAYRARLAAVDSAVLDVVVGTDPVAPDQPADSGSAAS